MAAKEIAKVEESKNIINQIKILYPHLKGVKDEEIAKAVALANTLELNPLKKEVHFVPYSGSVQLIVSYTEYIKRAERSGKLNGWKVSFGKDEIGEYADVVIYRKDWEHPFEWRVYLKEAQQNTPIWKKMPLFMLRKTAIAQAFRLAFPEEVGHLPYEEAELPSDEEQTASEAQKKYIQDLLKDKGLAEDYVKELYQKELSQISKMEASQLIEHLKNRPNAPEYIEAEVEEVDEEDIPF